MAVVTGTTLITRIREAIGAENDTHISPAELLRALTAGVSDTWDQILSMGIGTEGVKWAEMDIVAGTQEYSRTGSIWRINGAAASALTDFYQVSRMLVNETDGRRRPVPRVNPSEQYTMKAPTQTATVRLYYFPVAPTFTTGAETFDGINGWEEHSVMGGAIYIKSKKEDDTGQFRARKREIEARMAVMANRLRDEPPRVVRRANPYRRGYHIPYEAGVRAYDLRGGNFEMFA